MKVMRGSDAAAVREIEREVKLLRALKHPNILPALGFTKAQPESDRLCVVTRRSGPVEYQLLTPYYSGGSVWDEIERFNADPIRVWPFTEARCLRIFLQTCRAVAALHAKGLVHRDVKPHNIMLQPSERGEHAVLIDFGSAGILDLPVHDRHEAAAIKVRRRRRQ